jgi:hypothetical protein
MLHQDSKCRVQSFPLIDCKRRCQVPRRLEEVYVLRPQLVGRNFWMCVQERWCVALLRAPAGLVYEIGRYPRHCKGKVEKRSPIYALIPGRAMAMRILPPCRLISSGRPLLANACLRIMRCDCIGRYPPSSVTYTVPPHKKLDRFCSNWLGRARVKGWCGTLLTSYPVADTI